MLATVSSASLLGVEGTAVTVEVHAANGLPGFTIVGRPDSACREARDRVRAAITSSGLDYPLRRYTVNLAPTGVVKSGAGLDLAIAVGVLAATEQVPPDAVAELAFVGELGLDGSIRPVPGALPLVDACGRATVVVPPANVPEAALVRHIEVRTAPDLAQLVAALRGTGPWPEPAVPVRPAAGPAEPDLADVRGQPLARRALEVAAAGGHHLLMVGPPGSGKTMLARRLPGLLPSLDGPDALDVTRVHSAAGVALPPGGLVHRPPFRAPHHGASAVALIGGGSVRLQPGEISLAHAGVLFLDELGEFSAAVLDHLRQPLEEGVVRVSRAGTKACLPARFQLVAAMNPCPCGQRTSPDSCRCSDLQLARYCRRISGPLLDRFDLRIDVSPPDPDHLLRGAPAESSAVVRARVEAARGRARRRGVLANADLGSSDLDRWAPLDPEATAVLERAVRAGRLSGRGLHRVRRVARTVADLDGSDGPISAAQVAEACGLRTEPSFQLQRLVG